jgi:O-antigen/teichoic acid export membrane protein
MMDRSSLKHAAVYGLAGLLVQAAGLVLLPIYLRCLGPGDYGVLEVVGRLAETIGTCLLFGGFRQALMTFYQQAPDEPGRGRVVTATFVLVAAVCAVGGAVTLLLSPWLGSWLAGASDAPLAPWLIRLATLAILLEPFTLIPLALLQARIESRSYVTVIVAQFLVRVGLSILMVRALDWGVTGALAATALTAAGFGLFTSTRELRRSAGALDLRLLGSLVWFALPMLPGGLCFFLLHHGDRFFLLHWASTAEVGMYALGYKLGMVVAVFSVTPLYMVWSSQMYAVAQTPQAAQVFGQVFRRILSAYLLVGLGVCLFAGEMVTLLGGDAYAPAAWFVPPVVLACCFQAAASLMDAGLYVRHRTGLKLGVTVATAAVMLALYAALIPGWGGKGAALATVGGFAFLAVGTFLVSQRVFPVCYPWARLAGLAGLAGGLWLVGQAVPTGAWGIIAKGGLLVAGPALAWGLGLIPAVEKQAARDMLRAARVRLTGRPGRAAPGQARAA